MYKSIHIMYKYLCYIYSMDKGIEQKLDRILKELSTLRKNFLSNPPIPEDIDYLTEAQALERLGYKSKKPLQVMRKSGKLPFTSINGRNMMYKRSDINDLLQQNSTR